MAIRIQDIKLLADNVHMLGDEINREINRRNISLKEWVGIGQKLMVLVNESAKAVGFIKDMLRKEAAARADGKPGSHYFPGIDGSQCIVNIPTPVLQMKKDADIDSLRRLLGDKFDLFFETVVTYRPRKEFYLKTAACNEKEVQAIVDAVDLVDGTPRVMFKD